MCFSAVPIIVFYALVRLFLFCSLLVLLFISVENTSLFLCFSLYFSSLFLTNSFPALFFCHFMFPNEPPFSTIKWNNINKNKHKPSHILNKTLIHTYVYIYHIELHICTQISKSTNTHGDTTSCNFSWMLGKADNIMCRCVEEKMRKQVRN